jgi:hypothetical protein
MLTPARGVHGPAHHACGTPASVQVSSHRQAIAALYPALPSFRAVCASVDSNQTFVNDFARRTLGF